MLVSLRIKNIALIEECSVEFNKGVNVLSGETGAGKSIVIDSLSFVLGGRADKSLIRYGATQASVEGVFEVGEELFPIMEELGLEQDNMLIIKRTMTETRNEIRVNGNPFNLSMLKRLTSVLVDILGQHEHQSLLKVSSHLAIIDKYSGKAGSLLDKYTKIYNEYKETQSALQSFGDSRQRERRKESLEYQIDEIRKAELKEGEEEELIKLRDKYRNAEKLMEGVSGAYNSLDGEDFSVSGMLTQAIRYLKLVSNYDESLAELESRLEDARIEIVDIADTLEGYSDNFDFDQRSFDRVERRVDTIKLLKRKYGSSVEEILEELNKLEEEYDELANSDENIAKLQDKLAKLEESLYKSGFELSQERRRTALKFEKAILKELNDLAMKGTEFKVSFGEEVNETNFLEHMSSNGFDTVEFLISPNVGEPLKNLSKIASGGEMSRFMLAIKNIIAGLDGIETMVFDEIDTGISGRVAQTVAEKLFNISVGKQVIAVTHLPQLASFADTHFLISKSVVGGKTLTSLVALNEEERVEEVSRLAGAITEAGKLHAKQMIDNAHAIKKAKLVNG